MSDDLYYRGNGSYELAVKNRLNELERSGVKNTVAMLTGLQNMEYGIRGEIRESTCAIVASQSILAESFKDNFDSVNNNLAIGFDALNNTLNIGFEMMFVGMKEVSNSINAMSEAICNKIDEIHDIVNNPLLTASRELFRMANVNFEKGYFEEALDDCKAAVEKNKTDYISWYLLGQIYLFGAGKFSNVIDLQKAEESLFYAAKYIDADLGKSKEVDELGAQIYYYLGYARLLLSNDLLVEEKFDESDKKLEEAQKATEKSIELNPKNIKVLYDNAKELHFLGKDDETVKILKGLIRLDKKFALVPINDKNFESIWPDIEKAILELRDGLIEKCYSKLQAIENEVKPEVLLEYKQKIEKLKIKDLFTTDAFLKDELQPFIKEVEWKAELISECRSDLQSIENKEKPEVLLEYEQKIEAIRYEDFDTIMEFRGEVARHTVAVQKFYPCLEFVKIVYKIFKTAETDDLDSIGHFCADYNSDNFLDFIEKNTSYNPLHDCIEKTVHAQHMKRIVRELLVTNPSVKQKSLLEIFRYILNLNESIKNKEIREIFDNMEKIISKGTERAEKMKEQKQKSEHIMKVFWVFVLLFIPSVVLCFFELLLVSKYHPIWAGLLSLVDFFIAFCLIGCYGKSLLNRIWGFIHLLIGIWLFSGAGFVDGSHKVLAVINVLIAILLFFVKGDTDEA